MLRLVWHETTKVGFEDERACYSDGRDRINHHQPPHTRPCRSLYIKYLDKLPPSLTGPLRRCRCRPPPHCLTPRPLLPLRRRHPPPPRHRPIPLSLRRNCRGPRRIDKSQGPPQETPPVARGTDPCKRGHRP
jgi:hypothetical protein